MARKVLPEEPAVKFKKQTRVSKTAANLTRTQIEIVPDDPTRATMEGDVRIFLDQALRRFQLASDAENYDRIQGLEDDLMVDGEGQWDDDIKGKRKRKKRPCLTLNRLKPMVAHVANEYRMTRSSIQVVPVGGGADKTSAEIRQGLIRHIETESHAETVYDTAFERMITKGWSYFRVSPDWESELSHNQVIIIEGFTNDFCVYSDPNYEDPTGKDKKWWFIVYDYPRGEYMEKYPGSQAAGLMSYQSLGDAAAIWVTADSIRVAEYYYMDEQPAVSIRIAGGDGVWEDEIDQREDGNWYRKDDLEKMDQGRLQPEQVPPVPVWPDEDGNLVKRDSIRSKPKWCLFNAVEILEGDKKKDFKANKAGRPIAGKYLPMIQVVGQERMIRTQRRRVGMVRSARDAQRIYNYLASGFVEAVALAPKSPFIAAFGQIEDYKKLWDTLNEENWPYLPYKPRDVAGQAVPPPQRQNTEPAVAAYIEGLREFDNILKQIFNIYDPSLGTAKSDQSGRAIAGLQARSDSANMNWMDNMGRSQVYAGEVILEQIPDIYDTARIIVIDRANKKEQVVINQEFMDPKTGEKKTHDIAVGKFSCILQRGQSATKRQETVQTLTDITKNFPQVGLALAPLIMENMDSPASEDAAAIVRKLLPPQLQEAGSPEQLQSQLTQLQQQAQMLTQALQAATETIRTKQLDLASKETIAAINAQAGIAEAALKAGNAAGLQMATHQIQTLQVLLDQQHERQQAEAQAAHEVRLQQMQLDAQAQRPQPETA